MKLEENLNTIAFVGAGPGDPDLLTVKGRQLLDAADVVVYTGSLVPAALVQDIPAEIHNSASLNLEEMVDLMADAWRQGKKVVRLHTGDPSIFGAIGEQTAALDQLGIPWRIVPGVSSAMAAAAALGAELTLPEVSQTVIITRRAGRTPVPETEELHRLARHRSTMLILLSVAMIDGVVRDLLEGGFDESTPAAVVEKASRPDERIVRGTLATIASLAGEAGIQNTAIICVGEVFGQKKFHVVSKLYDRSFSHGCRNSSD